MRSIAYGRAPSQRAAIAAVARDPQAAFLAGGTSIIDLTKLNVELPATLIDVNALPLAQIERRDDALHVGALARMSDVADHPDVKRAFPAVSRALLLSASPQLRNMASIGGNLLQRTRCHYFRDAATRCNKREFGQGCTALGGENRQHAILGGSDRCICTHPSDLAVALLAADAVVHVAGPAGARAIPLAQFYVLPAADPRIETTLRHGELITSVALTPAPASAAATYVKVRDRASYEFALVSVAAGLDAAGGVVRDARLALGGVAPAPWRARIAERMLIGRPLSRAAFSAAAEAELAAAQPQEQNRFKVMLARNAMVRALSEVSHA